MLTRKLPIRYKTLAYRRYEVATLDRLIARIKYEHHDETRTDHRMFGNVTEFKKGYLRHLRKSSCHNASKHTASGS